MVLCYEKVTRSHSVKTITHIVMLLYVFIIVGIPMSLLLGEEWFWTEKVSLWTMLVIVVFTLVPVWVFLPRYVSVTDTCLKLYRGIGVSSFVLEDIKVIRLYSPSNVVTTCTFGIGGVGGFIGKFYNSEIGKYIAYVGDYSQAFLVVMKSGKKYLLSCQNPEKVVGFAADRLRKR